MLGITCRLHDAATADDLGVATLPPPILPGDIVATETDVYRVVDVITNPAGASIGALVKVAPARLAVAAT